MIPYGEPKSITVADLHAAAAVGPLALIKLTCGSNHSALTGIWAAAMTAHFGPTGLHESWCNADGTPSANALAKLPRLAEEMAAASERFTMYIDCYERDLARGQ